MKQLLIIFIVLLSVSLFPQSRVITKDLGTMANSVNETGFVDLTGWTKIDSISVTFIGKGEMDVDSLTLYRAVKLPDGTFKKDVSVLGNFTVTLNLADGVYDLEPLFSSNATLLTGAALRGIDAIYYVTRGATSGNDATDPNRGWIKFQIWGLQ
ncbi:MAG: hypothetical protein ACP5N7_03780 [Candidatus Pacearchaeota archaeon]